MDMKLRRYAGTKGSALILDTGGHPADRKEWQLVCCRSLTLPVDTLILGPLGAEQPFRMMALDLDGLTVPMGQREAEVFAAFLQDEGYASWGTVYVTDGTTAYAVPAGHHGWRAVSAPEGLRLQRLLGL